MLSASSSVRSVVATGLGIEAGVSMSVAISAPPSSLNCLSSGPRKDGKADMSTGAMAAAASFACLAFSSGEAFGSNV